MADGSRALLGGVVVGAGEGVELVGDDVSRASWPRLSPDGEWVAFADELGSIETGKLGDLVVLAGNPLDDIRQTASIVYVMKDGVVYDGDTLDEVWPEPAPYGAYPWLVPGIYETGDHPW